jgi:predicted RNA methylase
MDILNRLATRRFREIDDLLAFISIYDDSHRTRSFVSLLRSNSKLIRDGVCVEGGCGLGVFAAEMARRGARKVYAVEHNPLLARLARKRFASLPKEIARRIELVECSLEDFRPPTPVNLLMHEFYG